MIMESKIKANLERRIQKLERPVYVVLPECHSANVQEAFRILLKYPMIRPVALSHAMLQSKLLDPLIDCCLEDYWTLTKAFYSKQCKKGRMTQEEVDQFDLDAARKELYEPLNLALMMTRYGYTDAEVGGVEVTTADHTRKTLYMIDKRQDQKNIVCCATVEFCEPHIINDTETNSVFEQKFMTVVDPALGKAAMEYSFLTAPTILKSLWDSNSITQEVYDAEIAKIEKEKKAYILLKVEQALTGLQRHKMLTNEPAIGAFVNHSTAGSDKMSIYARFLREEVIPAIIAKLEEVRDQDEYLKDAQFISQECQVEAASDIRIARKKAKDVPYAGYANVHVCSAVDAANQHFKTFMCFMDTVSMISWAGFRKPVYDLSRSASVDDIVLSSLIAVVQSSDCSDHPDREVWYNKTLEVFNQFHPEKA